MLSKTSCISVQLLEPTIYVNSKSDLNNAIRGTIDINLTRTTTIKSISVRFDGKMETKGSAFDIIDATGKLGKKKAMARQRLVIYPTMEQENVYCPLVLQAGLTHYGFEMQIPSRLPESIDCPDIKVGYYVTAVIEYESQTFLGSRFIKECAKQQVHVTRLPYENIILSDDAQPVDSRTHRSSLLHYQILVSKKAVALGSELPITFRFMPQHEQLFIDRVGIQLLERREICKRGQCHTSYSIQNIAPSNSTQFPKHPLSELWEGTLDYTIPENKSIVHSTSAYSEFNVSHTLLVSLALSIPQSSGRFNSGRVQKMLTYQCHIDLLDASVGGKDVLKLPTYDFPPPFDNDDSHSVVFPEYDRKFVDPPAYSDLFTSIEA